MEAFANSAGEWVQRGNFLIVSRERALRWRNSRSAIAFSIAIGPWPLQKSVKDLPAKRNVPLQMGFFGQFSHGTDQVSPRHQVTAPSQKRCQLD
jgi:hypothetical protein